MKVITDPQNYSDIADSIRAKLGVETTYTPGQMAGAIDGITGGLVAAKTITANGTYSASDDSLDGYSEVTVNVPTQGGAYTENAPIVPTVAGARVDFLYQTTLPFEFGCTFVMNEEHGTSEEMVLWGYETGSSGRAPRVSVYDPSGDYYGIIVAFPNGETATVGDEVSLWFQPSEFRLERGVPCTVIHGFDGETVYAEVTQGDTTLRKTNEASSMRWWSNPALGANSAYVINDGDPEIDMARCYIKKNGVLVWGVE